MSTEPFVALAPIYDRVMAEIPYAAWVDYLEQLLRHWRGSAARVLDLACGTASVGLELARRGSRVVGIDRSRAMLAVGRTKAAAEGLPVALVRQDMARLGLAPAFDLAVCLFDSLNYLLDEADLAATCRGVRQALLPGGLFIFDLNTELALARELFTQEELEPDRPIRLRWRSRYDRRSRTTTVAMDFYLDGGRRVSETHRERAYSPAEVRAALEAAGLRTLAVYDAYTFDLPRRTSDRVFYVCRADRG